MAARVVGRIVGSMTERGGRPVRRFSTAETAQLVRQALAEAFPGQGFSVRSRSYSGGSSVDVRWLDGPTRKEVEQVTHMFEGARFDGMIDLKCSHTSRFRGEEVEFGADWVSCQREESADLLRLCAAAIADEYGVPAPAVRTQTSTHGGKVQVSAWVERGGPPLDPWNCASTAGDKVLARAIQTSTYVLPVVDPAQIAPKKGGIPPQAS